jgi:hypothetical protein
MKRSFKLLITIASLFTLLFSAAGISSPLLTPHDGATVKINFDGLIAVCFGNPDHAAAGFLNVHHHTPQIEITRIENLHRTQLAKLAGEELREVTFKVEGSQAGATRYITPNREKDANDFRWTIDLEKDIYQRDLYIQKDKMAGIIKFDSALWYADNISDQPLRFFSDKGEELPFNRRFAEPAANVNLQPGQALIITSGAKVIRLAAEDNVRYEIAITNTPPADMASMDHFNYYYSVLGEKVTAYSPVIAKRAAYSPRPIICSSVVASRSRLD